MSFVDHARAFKNAWRAENQHRRINKADWRETEFLPAALEVSETPPSPIGRAILWLIIAALLGASAWAFIGQIDTVSVAEGRLVPAGRLRSVEAAEQGVIRAIYVREGQHVLAGQTLLELDPTVANAEAATARTDLATASLTLARDNALLGYATGRSSRFSAPAGAEGGAFEAERALVTSRIDEYRARLTSVAERRRGAEATAEGANAEIVKLRRTLPLLKEALDLQRDLDAQGFGARQKLLQQEQAYIAAQQDLAAQIAKAAEARAAVASIAAESAQVREEFVGKAAEERAQAEGVVLTRGNTVREADQKRGLHSLVAPVSGIVQEVTITNIGEVPEIGKPLVTIVPDHEPLVVEALLLNKDAGFVRVGMDAAVKIEAYPFTRYGVLHGRVERVSPDSIVDQQRGLVFPVRVALRGTAFKVDGRPAVLSPGMTASAEIKTGRRRIIDYLWSPVAKTVREAGRER